MIIYIKGVLPLYVKRMLAASLAGVRWWERGLKMNRDISKESNELTQSVKILYYSLDKKITESGMQKIHTFGHVWFSLKDAK